MMNDRVILVQGNSGNWYEQAIFIIKKNVPTGSVPVNLVEEAEKIINRYHFSGATQAKKSEQKKTNRSVNSILNLTIALSSCLLIGLLALIMFGGH